MRFITRKCIIFSITIEDLHSTLVCLFALTIFLLAMALYSYTKAPIRSVVSHDSIEFYSYQSKEKGTTLGDVAFSIFGNVQEFLVNSKFIGGLIPVFLVLAGLGMIYQQFFPDFKEFLKLRVDYYDTTTVALASENYVSRAEYISNPGAEYFKQLREEVVQSNGLLADPERNEYKGRFLLSIPRLGIKNLKVTANVDSDVE